MIKLAISYKFIDKYRADEDPALVEAFLSRAKSEVGRCMAEDFPFEKTERGDQYMYKGKAVVMTHEDWKLIYQHAKTDPELMRLLGHLSIGGEQSLDNIYYNRD